MAVQIFKPNLDALQAQAERARAEQEKRKRQGDLAWGDLKIGDNIIRPLPPTNSRGIIGKKVAKHYFKDTALAKLGAQNCLVQTHAEIAGVSCPICDAGDRLLAQYPQLELKRWLSPGQAYYIQGVDRSPAALQEGNNQALIYRLTPAVYNWLVLQMEDLLREHGIDITDLQAGMDIKITKTEKQTKRGKRTEYTTTLWNIQGPTPLHQDQAVVQQILESMKDLDQIWQFPDDAGLAEINKAAADILGHYQSMAAQSMNTQPMGVPPAMTPQTMPQQLPQQQVQPQQPAGNPVAPTAPDNSAPPMQTQPVQSPPVQTQPAQQSLPVQPQVPQSNPQDKPACFGGATPRSDGGTGYSEDSELCLMCKYELGCMDATQQRQGAA